MQNKRTRTKMQMQDALGGGKMSSLFEKESDVDMPSRDDPQGQCPAGSFQYHCSKFPNSTSHCDFQRHVA